MVQDISAFGIRANLAASNTYPQGIDITQFADDTDPIDTPDMQIGDKKMSLNGILVVWSTAVAAEVTLAVIPGSDDDTNLAILFEANRVGANKQSARDIITLTVIYPDGSTKQFVNGKITNGMPAKSVASAGRLKTKTYKFAFENLAGGPA